LITILGDFIADFNLRIRSFPIEIGSMQKVDYMELGPGGACNVAITVARFGLPVTALGEVGDDRFGEIVLAGLAKEGVDIGGIKTTARARTPVAGVLVDSEAEPAYLGYPGRLRIGELLPQWRTAIQNSRAFFTEGWVDHQALVAVNLEALDAARQADVISFFDPGPGNPALDGRWRAEAAARASVILATEEEAYGLTGLDDPVTSAQMLLARGPDLVVIKRGQAGCLIVRRNEAHLAPGFPVAVVDKTGAGDTLDAAVIYGYLRGLDTDSLGTLANAAGAAKVEKRGTGHNVPTIDEIRGVLRRFGKDAERLLP
jgi:ribokinase